MKVMIKASTVLVFSMMVMSCATTPSAVPEKYNLDNELEAIDNISMNRRARFEQVDKQSIIYRAGWRGYYLLVVRQPIEIAPQRISSFTVLNKPRHGRVLVQDLSRTAYEYDIVRIYKLKGKEQAEEIKERFHED